MANCVLSLRRTIEDDYNISLGQREYEDWFRCWLDTKDVCKSAKETVIAAMMPEDEDEIQALVGMISAKF